METNRLLVIVLVIVVLVILCVCLYILIGPAVGNVYEQITTATP